MTVYRISLHTYSKQRDWPRKPDGTVDVEAIPMHDKYICERGHWQYEPERVEQLPLLMVDEDESRASIHELNESILDRWRKERP